MKLKGLYKKTDSGIYYYQPSMVKGVRPPPISLETKKEEEAVEAYYRVAQEAKREFSAKSLRMEAARWLLAMRVQERHTETTSAEAHRIATEFIDLTGNPPIGRVTSAHVVAYRDSLQARSLSPATVKAQVSRLSGLFTWAIREGLIDEHPCKRVDLPKNVPTRSERYCTQVERDLLIETLPEDRIDLQLVFWLGFFGGLRKREITEAHRDWVDLNGGVIHVKQTETFTPKGKRARMVRLSPRLLEFLEAYLSEVDPGDSPYLLRPDKKTGKKKKARGLKAWRYRFDPRRAFDSHCTRHGLNWVGFHSMRHTFATLHAIANTPLTIIAKELGDDYKTTFETYVGYTRQSNHAGATD